MPLYSEEEIALLKFVLVAVKDFLNSEEDEESEEQRSAAQVYLFVDQAATKDPFVLQNICDHFSKSIYRLRLNALISKVYHHSLPEFMNKIFLNNEERVQQIMWSSTNEEKQGKRRKGKEAKARSKHKKITRIKKRRRKVSTSDRRTAVR